MDHCTRENGRGASKAGAQGAEFVHGRIEPFEGQGLVAYPHREELHERRFWVCWPTRNCATRIAAHEAFDPLWKNGEMSREEAYAWQADAMRISALKCHVGWMDTEECRRVISVVSARTPIDF